MNHAKSSCSCSCFHQFMLAFSFSFALSLTFSFLGYITLPLWYCARSTGVMIYRVPNRLHQPLVGIWVIIVRKAICAMRVTMSRCGTAMDFTHCPSWRRLRAHRRPRRPVSGSWRRFPPHVGVEVPVEFTFAWSLRLWRCQRSANGSGSSGLCRRGDRHRYWRCGR